MKTLVTSEFIIYNKVSISLNFNSPNVLVFFYVILLIHIHAFNKLQELQPKVK